MDLSKICLATAMVLVISRMVLSEEPDYNNPDVALRHDMWILDADVRKSALSGYKRRFNLSDDEFSAQLVKLASVTTNGEDASLRMFTVAAIGNFGTSNALEFLENEALRGGDVAGGIRGFGAIVGFNDRFFNLAEQMLADKSVANSMRRKPVYNVFESILCSDVYRGKTITPAIRGNSTESLKRHALTDSRNRVRIDLILSKYGPEAQFYRHSPTRRHLAELAMADADSSDYERGYFKNVLEQIGAKVANKDDTRSSETSSRKTDKHTGAKLAEPTSGRSVNKVDSPTSSETVDADKPITHAWHIMMVCGVLLFALAFLFIRLRKRRPKARWIQ